MNCKFTVREAKSGLPQTSMPKFFAKNSNINLKPLIIILTKSSS